MWFNGEYSMTSRCARLCVRACARVRVVLSPFRRPTSSCGCSRNVANLVFAFVQIVNAGSEFVDQGSF